MIYLFENNQSTDVKLRKIQQRSELQYDGMIPGGRGKRAIHISHASMPEQGNSNSLNSIPEAGIADLSKERKNVWIFFFKNMF